MKKVLVAALAALLLPLNFLSAQDSAPKFKVYGFIRNYFTYDSHEGKSGTEDFFYYLPNDNPNYNTGESDPYQVGTFRFASLTSRVGLDVTGYQVAGWNVGAKIEADFYAGLTGSTGTAQLRLRQAYMTLAKNDWSFKIGQAWHPMAADMPDVISLNVGAPFGPFSRTPMLNAEYKASDAVSFTAAALWQMQYTSAGPNGASANYMRFGCTPEFYFAINVKSRGFLARVGADVLSISPRAYDTPTGAYIKGSKKVDDRITTVSAYAYIQYSKNLFSVKAKTTFAQAGEHMNLNGGYAVSKINPDGSWDYTPTRNSSTWVSLKYGKKVQAVLFGGYVKNFGAKDEVVSAKELSDKYAEASINPVFFSKNSYSNMNQMWRISPQVIYNLGKVSFALEYEATSVQYGKGLNSKALSKTDLHWITNNRVQMMAKFTF